MINEFTGRGVFLERSTGQSLQNVIAQHAEGEGALLPVLWAIQAAFGWISDDAVALTAEVLNLSRAEVHGVLTFYHDLRRAPAGRHVLKLCRAEACQARGARKTQSEIEAALGLEMGETTPDGAVTLEGVYCLGLCASGPAALLDGRPIARLTGARLAALIETATS